VSRLQFGEVQTRVNEKPTAQFDRGPVKTRLLLPSRCAERDFSQNRVSGPSEASKIESDFTPSEFSQSLDPERPPEVAPRHPPDSTFARKFPQVEETDRTKVRRANFDERNRNHFRDQAPYFMVL
jgi:hypothetical protein